MHVHLEVDAQVLWVFQAIGTGQCQAQGAITWRKGAEKRGASQATPPDGAGETGLPDCPPTQNART